ncbi:MAG: carboxypeptidase regulatory-like domain-containing protein [Gammaproteobacteria bacterium]|nr:carboxypeptidase regulatory-like domain-containing protein [Gammaproteobacteria bacterium]NVK87002.1 carboxypeptidase regulatory-like domain-containing protein [Gammaproteobacteria bacterium]
MAINKGKKVSIAEANRVVEDGLAGRDQSRVKGLAGLMQIRKSKAKLQSREQNRLKQRYGSKDERVVQLQRKFEANETYLSGLKMETYRAQPDKEVIGDDRWVAKGRVYDRRGCPIEGVKVTVMSHSDKPVEAIKPVMTDAQGRFRIEYKEAAKEGEVTTPEAGSVENETAASSNTASSSRISTNLDSQAALSSGLRINQGRYQQSIYLLAVDGSDDSLCAQTTLMVPKLGSINYRDIIFDTDRCSHLVSDLEKDRRASRFLGNASTTELHDLENEKASCQINEIRIDRCVRFKSIKEAQALGYDFCAYCFSKQRSKR